MYKVHRPFEQDGLGVNTRYRNWMIRNVGEQGIDWWWHFTEDGYTVQINFIEKEHAVLFELSWQ